MSGKESACQSRRRKRPEFDPWVKKIPWSRKWQPTPVLLRGKSHGQRSLVGYSPWGHKESDTTERPSTQQKPDRCSRLCPFPLPSRGSQLFRLRIPPLACLPIQATAEHSVELPVLCRRLSLLISSVRSTHGVYKSIPVSRFLPHPPVPLVSHTVLYVCVCISALIL